jgi:type VI secretion system secreted protein Hcp
MRNLILSSLLAAGLFSSTAAQAAVDTFLEFKGPATKGGSTDSQFPGAVQVLSYSWGASNPTSFQTGGGASAGKVSISSFNIVKVLDSASTTLFKFCASGQHYDEVKISMRKSGEKEGLVFLVITLQQVYVESVQWSASSEIPTESVSLAFAKVLMEYKSEGPGGQLETESAGWDVLTNTP